MCSAQEIINFVRLSQMEDGLERTDFGRLSLWTVMVLLKGLILKDAHMVVDFEACVGIEGISFGPLSLQKGVVALQRLSLETVALKGVMALK